MHTGIMRLLRGLAAAAALAALAIGTAAAIGKVADNWRLQVSGGSWNGGTIVMQFVENGSDVIEVTITIPKFTGENKIARLIRDQLKKGLPKDRFKVEVDDAEDVLVKARGGTRPYEIRIVSNTAHTRINPDHE
jgi:stress-induced morphogen